MAEHIALIQMINAERQRGQTDESSPCRAVNTVDSAAAENNGPEFKDFNISGTVFTVKRKLLLKYPRSKLAALEDLDEYWSKEKAAYYFDRDPELFNAVLNIFRYDLVSVPAGYSELMFKKELKFWNIIWDELEVSTCIDLDEELEKEFEWMEGRIPPPPSSVSIHAKRKYLLWCFLTDPMGQHTPYPKAATTFAFVNISLTILYLILFGMSTDSYFRVAMNETTGKLEPVVCQDRLVCLLDSQPQPWLDKFIFSLILYFLLETLLRLLVCPDYKIYLWSFITCSDIIATICVALAVSYYIVPNHYYHALQDEARRGVVRLTMGLLTTQVLRIFKIFQYATLIDGLMVMVLTLKASLKELGLLVIYLVVCMFIFSTLVTFVELHSNDGIPNCLIGYWWAIITMTTVGYGDYYPSTPLGYVVGVFCAVTGLIMTALPVAVIGNNFNRYWDHNNKRKKIREANLTKTGKDTLVNETKA